ncbi:MAG: GNAT family N-acetyltransferase [Allgaiera sp.]|jgi:RimJ/RimL family protein N-acetyltransferase|nr:GNAT family N-acetyltransferase [Allgaiera sp.]
MTRGTRIPPHRARSRAARFTEAPNPEGPGGPFAGMATYETSVSPGISAPVIETDRLILRGPEGGDFDAFTKFYASERSTMNGGPLDPPQAWRAFATAIGHWTLRGYGMWSLVERSSGALVGRVGLWYPGGWPEPELGWTLYDGFEGRGLAQEAALAARSYAYDMLGLGPLISVIAPDNLRSIALARRLGATHERDWALPSGAPVWIYRHPDPEAT